MKTWKTESFEMLFGYPAEAERAKKEAWPILIPVGTMEYHSHHCPYGCDSLVAMGLADRLANEVNCVVMPPIYYGVASYAVGGADKNTIHVDCDTFEQYVYCVLKSLFRSGFHKNIFFVIAHQTEDFNPMELACQFSSRDPRDRQELRDCADEMERILMAERENAAATIPLVEFDSILGFEPSMEYVCDRAALEWGPPGLRRTECNM